jgi:GntR family transcriptional repressor for pyruvate dehydrogenase complex
LFFKLYGADKDRLAAARPPERSTPQLVKALRTSVTDIGAATSLGLFRRADTTFHLTLADAAECPPLRRAIEDARIAMFDQLDVVDFDIIVASALEGHGAITEAVAARDPAAARAAMEAHVAGLRKEILDLVGQPRRRRVKGS